MRKLLALVFVAILAQVVNAKPLFNEYNTQILSIDGRFATVADSDDIVVGSSGIVMHAFDATTSTVVARVDVVEKSNGNAKLRFDVYNYSAQTAFPIPGILPQVGDKVTINYLYDRSLIVTPNFEVFKELTNHFTDMEWVHPDLVGAYLAQEYKPNPDREDFQTICRSNAAGLIFFALDYNAYFVDCNNFQVIKEFKSSQITKVQLPFYTRVQGIDSSWFNWGSGQISDYSNHYENLIRK